MDYGRLGANGSPYREFPLLVPFFPQSVRGLYALRRNWPLLRGELFRSRRLYRLVLKAPKNKRRKVFIRFYRDTYHLPLGISHAKLYGEISGFLRRADQFIQELVREYFVEGSRGQFTINRKVRATDDPIGLLGFCFQKTAPTDAAGRKRAFEARRKLVLAQLLYEIFISARDDLLEYDQQMLTRHYEKNFFTKRSEKVLVRSVHDPDNGYQTVGILPEGQAAPPGMKVVEKPLTFRFFRGHDGQEIPVIFESGVKTNSSHLEKMLRKGIRDPDAIIDLRRYLLVFRNRWEMDRGLRVLRERVHCVAGVIHDHSSNIWTNGRADDANPHSSPAFRQKKFVVMLDGRRFEGMVQTLPDYLDGKYARNDKNHALYKLRQRLSSTFPILFPAGIYGTDWKDPLVEVNLRSKFITENSH